MAQCYMQCGREGARTYTDSLGRKRAICRPCIDRKAKPNKYGAKALVVDGKRCDSKSEGARYADLKLLEKAGEIRELKFHPRFPLDVNGMRICIYEADASYFDVSRGTVVVEDTKGARTALYTLKKKLLKACHGIDVLEIEA